ncbi:MAG: YihY/virulence factor BrkB family protein [Nitrobacter sp.]
MVGGKQKSHFLSERRKSRSEKGSDEMAEGDRGRSADRPSEIPPSGWWNIIRRTLSEFFEDRILAVAAGVTFYALLAIFPGIAALISVYGLFADPASVSGQLGHLSGIMPGGTTEILGDQMTRLATQKPSSLGLGFAIGLGAALWSASAGMKAMFDALNIVYDENEKRSFIKLGLLGLLFTLGAIAFLLIAFGAVVVLPVALNIVGLGGISELLMWVLRWPALFILAAIAFGVIYRFGPSRTKAKWRSISWGSVSASILWVVGSLAFSWYVQNFGSYNQTYGSLGAAIGFMTWIWLSTTIFLLGAELNSEIEHQTEHDTTIGDDKPGCERGATASDTVGRAVT